MQLRLFAPFLPFVTEEVWSWWQEGSIHRATWPDADEVLAAAGGGDPELTEDVASVLTLVRKAKSEAKASMKTPITSATVTAPAASIARLQLVAADLVAVGTIAQLDFVEGSAITVDAELASAD